MEKANILKALEKCSKGFDSCAGCQYEGTDSCASVLAGDALALLKTSEATKVTAHKYTYALVFTKTTSMRDYCTGKVTQRATSSESYKRMCDYYAKEREVQLIAMFRYDERGKCLCKIKCPINPLPVKGEFETPSTGVVSHFLSENGWSYKQTIYPRMFD